MFEGMATERGGIGNLAKIKVCISLADQYLVMGHVGRR